MWPRSKKRRENFLNERVELTRRQDLQLRQGQCISFVTGLRLRCCWSGAGSQLDVVDKEFNSNRSGGFWPIFWRWGPVENMHYKKVNMKSQILLFQDLKIAVPF